MKTNILQKYIRMLLSCLTFFIVCNAEAQDIPFVPPSYNYTTNHYDGGNQNWAVAQGKDGIMYIGNNNGLLTFDGTNWQLYELPNKLSVKSI
ncbi:hypothetical protein [Porphyromonas pogonae]|uniref:hypothetical protein n=1 Tax=Porphyromonas pogonae TaxID=867595 RepID=UPI002E772CB1|nr:hypothetical protein [Porphyromonas pogonae]